MRVCTSKRAFVTRDYAEMFRRYLGDYELSVYRCKFCEEYHLGHLKERNGTTDRHR